MLVWTHRQGRRSYIIRNYEKGLRCLFREGFVCSGEPPLPVLSKEYLVNFQGRSWASDRTIPLDLRLTRWAYETMLTQRGISLGDIGKEAGVTKQAVHLWVNGITSADREQTREDLIMKLDDIISKISQSRHDSIPHSWCKGRESICVPIILTHREDLRVAEAKFMGEVERLDHARGN